MSKILLVGGSQKLKRSLNKRNYFFIDDNKTASRTPLTSDSNIVVIINKCNHMDALYIKKKAKICNATIKFLTENDFKRQQNNA